MITDEVFLSSVRSLLEKAGNFSPIQSITHCAGGNNRSYRVDTSEGRFLLKQYFKQAHDLRDRLASEFSFLTFAKEAAPHFVPMPYVKDAENALALYEFIEGKPMTVNDITPADIDQAIQFFCELNIACHQEKANALPLASEACFSLKAHMDLIDARLQALLNIHPESKEDENAKKLIRILNTRWQIILTEITKLSHQRGDSFTSPLDKSQRCLSPSDFGFHNALKMPNGRIQFLDFEYAGWDDPAKMVGDFFSQVAVPIPTAYLSEFTRQVMQPFPAAQDLIHRAVYLRPAYQIKWCCIVLNIFLPIHLKRRQFANAALDITTLKRTQLDKAAALLQQF